MSNFMKCLLECNDKISFKNCADLMTHFNNLQLIIFVFIGYSFVDHTPSLFGHS